MTEDEMARWHHKLDGHEFEHALGVDDGQGILMCCSPCLYIYHVSYSLLYMLSVIDGIF